jgi:hypothetical protein
LALVTSLKGYINAGVKFHSLLEWDQGTVSGALAAAVGSNCEKGQVNFSFLDSNEITQYGTIWISNPNLANFELVDGVGYRMLPNVQNALQALMRTASGNVNLTIQQVKHEYKTRAYGSGTRNASCLKFIDAIKNVVYMSFPMAIDKAALLAFGAALNTGVGGVPYTKSILNAGIFLTQTDIMNDPDETPGEPESGAWDCVEDKAYVRMAYMDGTKKKRMQIMLPAIKQTNCELKVGTSGWKVLKSVGGGVALALTSFFGSANRTLWFESSRVDVKNQKNQ